MFGLKNKKKQVIAYLHTHWDREWYREYEVFRLRLLKVFDNVLSLLDQDKFRHFTLMDKFQHYWIILKCVLNVKN